MEYLFLIGLTSFIVWSIIKVSGRGEARSLKKNKYRQSDIYEINKIVFPKQKINKIKIIKQSEKHIQKNMLRVVMDESKAYWILNNIFYSANATNGRVDEQTAKPLNFDNMSKKELNKMLSILDNLKQGIEINDSGSAGDKRV
jgi:hypothetical protein